MAQGKTTKKTMGKKSLPFGEALLEKFRAPAEKIASTKVIPCRADVNLAIVNVKVGLENVFGAPGDPDRKARAAALQEALPKLAVKKVLALDDLVHAVLLASQKVTRPEVGEIDRKLEIVRSLREPMLTTAEVLAGKGLLPAGVVVQIRQGTGKVDIANDGLALAGLYEENAAKLEGKHPFTTEDITTLRTASKWLVDRLLPSGAKKAAPKATVAEDLRDRLWTLVVERHADLRVLGYYLFRDELDASVPKLQSRSMSGGPNEQAPEAQSGESAPEPQGAPQEQ